MFRLFSPFISGLASSGISGVVKRTKIQVLCWAVIAAAMFFAVVFACLLAYHWLRTLASPIMSAALLCAFWGVVAGMALVVMKVLSARQKNRHKKQMAQDRANLLFSSALAAIPTAFTVNRKFALAAAVPLLGIALLALLNHSEKGHKDE